MSHVQLMWKPQISMRAYGNTQHYIHEPHVIELDPIRVLKPHHNLWVTPNIPEYILNQGYLHHFTNLTFVYVYGQEVTRSQSTFAQEALFLCQQQQ